MFVAAWLVSIKPGSNLNSDLINKRLVTLQPDGRILLMFSCKFVSNSFVSPWAHLQPTSILCPRDFPGKNIGVGCRFLLQGIFLTQGLNSNLYQASIKKSRALRGKEEKANAEQRVQHTMNGVSKGKCTQICLYKLSLGRRIFKGSVIASSNQRN